MGWNGSLSTENVEQVAERLRQLLENRRFTITAWQNVDSGLAPRFMSGQPLEPIAGRDAIRVLSSQGSDPSKLFIWYPGHEGFGLAVYPAALPIERRPSFRFEDGQATFDLFDRSGRRCRLAFTVET